MVGREASPKVAIRVMTVRRSLSFATAAEVAERSGLLAFLLDAAVVVVCSDPSHHTTKRRRPIN